LPDRPTRAERLSFAGFRPDGASSTSGDYDSTETVGHNAARPRG